MLIRLLLAVPPIAILLGAYPARAQQAPALTHCIEGTSQCFDSLAKAEAALRATQPFGPFLYKDRVVRTSSGKYRVTFRVGDNVPLTVQPPVFSTSGTNAQPGCTSAHPILKTWCATEEQSAQVFAESDPFYLSGCQYTYDHQIVGDYAPRASSSGTLPERYGEMAFYTGSNSPGNRALRYVLQCSQGPRERYVWLSKRVTWTCPGGWYPKENYQLDRNNYPGHEQMASSQLCISFEERTIITDGSCPVGFTFSSATGKCAVNPKDLGPCDEQCDARVGG